MSQLSNEALSYTTTDFELRLTEVPDVDNTTRRTVYGIFNRLTNVREGFTEQLWMAVLAVHGSQTRLDAAMKAIKDGSVDTVYTEDLAPPRLN